MGVDCKKLECGPGTFHDGCPSSLGIGVGGQSYSNFLASTVGVSKNGEPNTVYGKGYRIYGIWYNGIWEFPKTRAPTTSPNAA